MMLWDPTLNLRTAAVSGLIVIFTLLLMLLAQRFAGLTRQLR
jgi:putative spermidine/putrescine transport system permease protein